MESQDMDDPQPRPSDRTTRRRLLLGGAALAPVLTLRPGTAWAMSLTGCQARYGGLDLTDPGVVDTISPSCQLSLGLKKPHKWK